MCKLEHVLPDTVQALDSVQVHYGMPGCWAAGTVAAAAAVAPSVGQVRPRAER